MAQISIRNKISFWLGSIVIIASSVFAIIKIQPKSESDQVLDIVPIIISTKEHKKPKRTPGTFAEEFGPKASKSELIFNGSNSFTFKYTKSELQRRAFTGLWFPLENVEIDFSKFDDIIVGIKANKARRIPFNLSVQNLLHTHQYVRNYIEVKKGQEIYTLHLKDFITPESWYEENGVAQVDIPDPDMSKIEALSFESCGLLKAGEPDEFTIYKLDLIKYAPPVPSMLWINTMIISGGVVLIIGLWILLFQPFKKGSQEAEKRVKDMEDGLEVGKRIQEQAMADMSNIREHFNDSFIIFNQRDIVGGDFFWTEQSGDRLMVVVGDCTGHGVAGSLLTMMAINLLHEGFAQNPNVEPGELLNYLNRGVKRTQNKTGDGFSGQNGMDVSIMAFDIKTRKFTYSNAVNPIMVIRNDEVHKLEINRISVGLQPRRGEVNYETYSFDCQEGDLIIMNSDGIADQMKKDGSEFVKYSSKRFRDLLIENASRPLSEINDELLKSFSNWKGSEDQTDDVIVLGLRA